MLLAIFRNACRTIDKKDLESLVTDNEDPQ